VCVYVWVLLCVGVCMCGYFDNCVGVLAIFVLVFTVFCIVCAVFFTVSFMYIFLIFFV
jgi:hypothetical protein